MFSKTMLIGNLGADPELRYTSNGKAVCNFSVATNDRFSDKPEWHRIVVWGKVADACAKHLVKGRTVCVEGKIQYRKWTDRDGITRYTTEIVAGQVTFLPGGPHSERTTQSNEAHEAPEAEVSQEAQQLLNSDDGPF